MPAGGQMANMSFQGSMMKNMINSLGEAPLGGMTASLSCPAPAVT